MTHTLPITFLDLLIFPRYIVKSSESIEQLQRTDYVYLRYIHYVVQFALMGRVANKICQPHNGVGLLASAGLALLIFLQFYT